MVKRILLSLLGVTFVLTLLFAPASATAQIPTPTPTPDVQGCIPPANQPYQLRFNGARPESQVLKNVDLLTQPLFGNDSHPIKLVTIPQDSRVVVFDIDNVVKQWYRVLWACDNFSYSGWIPTDAVDYFDQNANPKVAPPGCVQSVTTLDSVDDVWTSTIVGRMVVVVDLFRAPDPNNPIDTFFYLTADGQQVHDKDREIKTYGPFLLNGEVINDPKVSQGMVIGFIATIPNPAFRMFATVYLVPDGCKWNVK